MGVRLRLRLHFCCGRRKRQEIEEKLKVWEKKTKIECMSDIHLLIDWLSLRLPIIHYAEPCTFLMVCNGIGYLLLCISFIHFLLRLFFFSWFLLFSSLLFPSFNTYLLSLFKASLKKWTVFSCVLENFVFLMSSKLKEWRYVYVSRSSQKRIT